MYVTVMHSRVPICISSTKFIPVMGKSEIFLLHYLNFVHDTFVPLAHLLLDQVLRGESITHPSRLPAAIGRK